MTGELQCQRWIGAAGKVIVEIEGMEDAAGFWIAVIMDHAPLDTIGPFDTKAERDLAVADFGAMLTGLGAERLPPAIQ